MYAIGASEATIYVTTALLIVLVDLAFGVLVGFGMSAVKLLIQFSHLDIEVEADELLHRYQLKMRGAATFLRLPLLAEQLEKLPADAELHVCLHEVSFIDHACFELLMDWAEEHVSDGGTLYMDWSELHGKFKSQVPRYQQFKSEAPVAFSATLRSATA